MDVFNSEYAEWLEELIKAVVEYKPSKIGCVFYGEGEEIYTKYFGECYPPDKALMAYWIHSDATMDTVLANAKIILEEANNESGDYLDDDE